jgi:hypothetical protein
MNSRKNKEKKKNKKQKQKPLSLIKTKIHRSTSDSYSTCESKLEVHQNEVVFL